VTLLLAAASFALLYVVNAMIQTVRGRTRIGFIQTLLAFLAVLLPLAALIRDRQAVESVPLVRTIALGIAVGMVILNFLVMLLELRRPERLKGSRGLLGIGAGLLIVISAFSVPMTADYAFSLIPATPTPLVVLSSGDDESTAEVGIARPTATPTWTPSPTLASTPTATRRSQATPTLTATRFQFVTRTPQPTATLPDPCLALANYNVNLRASPEADAEVLSVISYNNTITLFGRNADSSWWYGEYEGEAGWVKGEFLALSASCDALPEWEAR